MKDDLNSGKDMFIQRDTTDANPLVNYSFSNNNNFKFTHDSNKDKDFLLSKIKDLEQQNSQLEKKNINLEQHHSKMEKQKNISTNYQLAVM